MIELRGISWNHSRAFPPLIATAQRFEERNPQVRIRWEKRTLDEFGHASLVPLAKRFDLLIIDHPMLGTAVSDSLLEPLDEYLDRNALSGDFAGPSFESYVFDGALWALPIDAAAPAASYRPDVLSAPPRTWEEVIELAHQGLVVMPGFPVDVFLNFMGLCETEPALRALDLLRELACLLPAGVWEWSPIDVYEAMSSDGPHAYCPFAYTYNNYARAGFSPFRLRYAEPPAIEGGTPVRTILGGTGLAISQSCRHIEIALNYAKRVASPEWQCGIYALAGGQPAHRSAWADTTLNSITDNFFRDTMPSLERAVIRPRYAGYTEFQAAAGAPVVDYVRRGGLPRDALEAVNCLRSR